MEPILLFAGYLGTALLLLAVFAFLYTKVTPYDDFALIGKNNAAAAIILGAAVLGMAFPLLSAVYFTHSYLEMAKWAAITGLVQIAIFSCLRRYAGSIAQGHVAPAILLAFISVAVGMLNAVCISY